MAILREAENGPGRHPKTLFAQKQENTKINSINEDARLPSCVT